MVPRFATLFAAGFGGHPSRVCDMIRHPRCCSETYREGSKACCDRRHNAGQTVPAAAGRGRSGPEPVSGGTDVAKGERQGCPPRGVRGSARRAPTASSVNQAVKLSRRRKPPSRSRQLVVRRFRLGTWRPRSWLGLKGRMGIRGQARAEPSAAGRFRTPPGGSTQRGRSRGCRAESTNGGIQRSKSQRTRCFSQMP